MAEVVAPADARSRANINTSFVSTSNDALRQAGNYTTMSPLNNSVSKQMFSFSKAGRFAQRRM